jgi:transcriptional regulator of acetoin/glycerol metabolism
MRGVSSGPPVRTLVAQSWQRSAAAGVDADGISAPLAFEASDLADYRDAHTLARVFPVLYDVLGRAAVESDSIMAIGDADGTLLWVSGSMATLRQAESINFVEGASWAEPTAGTNAPGTALRLDAPVQIRSLEHFNRSVQRWTCAAAPIHDPRTHAILGVVDVTGGDEVSSPMTIGMVRAAARLAESELARLLPVLEWTMAGDLAVPAGSAITATVSGLGRPDCLIQLAGRTIRLSPRHSEIVVILAGHPEGLTGDQLALELYADDVQSSTMRAELARLKAILGSDVIDSRPYRLRIPVVADWLDIEGRLVAGQLNAALRLYAGPLLPQSDAPAVVRRRDRLTGHLRAAIIASGDLDLMISWTRRRWGADDLEMWQRQARALSPTSPLRPLAVAEVRRLNREFG